MLGIDNDGEVVEFACGVLNVNTGVEATPDSLFQIGSITKAFTATLVMQLVDENRVDLDAPASQYIPGLRFGHDTTVRRLLTHTSGVDGDFVDDFGRNDDAIEKYVDACADLEQIVAPGHLYSYCNAGFVVLGRLVEAPRSATCSVSPECTSMAVVTSYPTPPHKPCNGRTNPSRVPFLVFGLLLGWAGILPSGEGRRRWPTPGARSARPRVSP